jgi:hypothetical protein
MVGPVPGRTPMQAPIAVPRRMGPTDSRISSQVGKRWVTFSVKSVRTSVSPRLLTISATANTPTATMTKLNPSVSS